MEITNKYQVMPPLSEEEYQGLKEDIAENGVQVRVVLDADGNIIDGYHRVRAWQELNAEGHDLDPYPEQIRSELTTDAEKRDLAWRLNMQRRHLNQAQKRDAIAAKLKESPEWADNRIALLLGVDHKTVRSVRDSLEARNELARFEVLEGTDGKRYPRERPREYIKMNIIEQEQARKEPVEDFILVGEDDEELLAERRAREEAEEKLRKEREAKKEALHKQKAETKKSGELAQRVKALEASRQELSDVMRQNIQEHLADVYARYNIPEVPEIFQISHEEFREAVQGARTKREEKALDILQDAMTLVGRMMEYDPEEAARAFLKWPSPDRSKRAVKNFADWMQKCVDELEAQTTPGTLRVMQNGE